VAAVIVLAGHEFEERKLIYRVLAGMRKPTTKTAGHQRWVQVMQVFCVGSSVARALCQEFQFDPDERVLR